MDERGHGMNVSDLQALRLVITAERSDPGQRMHAGDCLGISTASTTNFSTG